MKGVGGIDGGSGGSLDDVMCDERGERECGWGQIYPLLSPQSR